MKNIGNFISVDHVRRINQEQGYLWFNPDTMQSFKTKL